MLDVAPLNDQVVGFGEDFRFEVGIGEGDVVHRLVDHNGPGGGCHSVGRPVLVCGNLVITLKLYRSNENRAPAFPEQRRAPRSRHRVGLSAGHKQRHK